jgi:hypothetical protein
MLSLLCKANYGLAEGTLKRLDFITVGYPFAVDHCARNSALGA